MLATALLIIILPIAFAIYILRSLDLAPKFPAAIATVLTRRNAVNKSILRCNKLDLL